MPTSEKDYRKLYQLQNKVLIRIGKTRLPFYLTGGTALGRFYLNHRLSDDLDFFVNNDPHYSEYIKEVQKILKTEFNLDTDNSLVTEDFSRFFIKQENVCLKIDFVNDLPARTGKPYKTKYFTIDNAENILTNKISAIMGRDEPKDVFDIVHFALNYSFNWQEVFLKAKRKSIINEIDFDHRLREFPAELFKRILPLVNTNITTLKKQLHLLSDDFLFGKDNSLATSYRPLSKAKPVIDINP